MIDLISESFSLTLILTCATSFGLGVYVLSSNPRNSINRSFFILTMFASYWTLYALFRHLTTSLTEAKFWFHVIFLWPFVIVALTRFVIIFCQSGEILHRKSAWGFLYLPASIFSLYWLFGNMDQYLVRRPWGWQVNVSTFHPVSLLIAIWAILLAILVSKIALDYYSTIENELTRQQTKWVLLATSFTVAGALLSEVIFRTLDFDLPPITTIGFGITCILLALSMLKFRLFHINPEVAAQNILAQMTESVFLLDLDGKIRSINFAASKMLNYSEGELLGNNILSIVIDHNKNIHAIEDLINSKDPSLHRDYELEFLGREGKRIPVSISNSFIKRGDVIEPKGMVWVCKDITKQKQLEEERQMAESIRRELEEKRLSFISMTSHELRTPLTAILGYTEFLEKTLTTDFDKETFSKQLGIVKKNALRLDRLTRGMMDITQIDGQKFRIKKEKVNFLDFLDESLSIYKTKLKDKFVIDLNDNKSPIMLKMDPDRINQVLVNIIDNAIKNSKPDQLSINVKLKVEEKSIDLRISDKGPGIKPNDLDKIFEKFVSIPTRNSVIGSGIGLYVSRMIIKAHGGSLNAKSAGLGKGATFHISLPK